MIYKRSIFLNDELFDCEFAVCGAVPTVLFLMADLSRSRKSKDFLDYWKHKYSPLERLGRNWPRENKDAREFLLNDLERSLEQGYDIHLDLVLLGELALDTLDADERSFVRQANSANGLTTTICHIEGNVRPIESISDCLPDNFALPFIGEGKVFAKQDPARIEGFEFSTVR